MSAAPPKTPRQDARGRIVLATGGTGGHIYPALATAQALALRGFEVTVVGQQAGLEARLVPAAGLPFYGVRAGKWHRGRPDPRQALQAALGLGDARRYLRQLRPELVLGFGGFASFPALAAARLLGVPYALHEQNTYPGKVTRWFAKGARFVAGAAAETGQRLGVALEVVGVPVREQRLAQAEARRRLGLPETGLVTLVMGGSQGSLVLNRTVPEAYRALPETLKTDLTVLHSSGPAHLGATQHRAAGLSNYRVDAYLDGVLAWSAADLGITRAGNGTIAEAAFHGVPLLLVPLPSAAEDHQRHNAQAVAAAGAGLVVPETVLASSPEPLVSAWQTLLDPAARAAMHGAALLRSPEGAAQRLAALVERTVSARALPVARTLETL